MGNDAYLLQVIDAYAIPAKSGSRSEIAAMLATPGIKAWGREYLENIMISGSYAKGTAIRGGSDIDLFISISPTTPGNLQEMYDTLYNRAIEERWAPKKQDVSIRVTIVTTTVDLVPGRRQDGTTEYHSIWSNRRSSWTQTNVNEHIRKVSSSARLDEIRALKIWRNRLGLDFPSFYLELAVIRALNGAGGGLFVRTQLALAWIAGELPTARIEDPANTANIVSDCIDTATKHRIAGFARDTVRANTPQAIVG